MILRYFHSLRKVYVEMAKKQAENKQNNKTSGAEKPVSLWGPSFREVVDALVKTKPIQKGKSVDETKKEK
jgi:hypothetical protein